MSKTESMVERVARAIYEGRNGAGCKAWGSQPKAHRLPYLCDARAAIAAMREGTPAVLGALLDAVDAWQDGKGDDADIWRRTIDAALSEESE